MNENPNQVHHPGEIVPDSGIYECDCRQHHGYSTDVRGHRFPPPPEGCTGHGWRLKDAAHPDS
ncbi:hypothetical protein OKJ48_29870 [Streptomyces kunmingensis]|uniref:Uncharacterized protein n=1 Tax=Streptomyces kunmingensis TaxID=68225 RepID=A0ABU6CJ62_9ACTN|nr:hypothetical protein [Streptomyces kunmingensis]MEB3964410.1 hypothetical protein [Streptomyces kunmingensis]